MMFQPLFSSFASESKERKTLVGVKEHSNVTLFDISNVLISFFSTTTFTYIFLLLASFIFYNI